MDNIRFFRVKSTSSVFFFAGSGSKGKNIFTRLYILSSGYDNIFCSGFRGEGLQPASEDRYGDGRLDREIEQLLIYIDTAVRCKSIYSQLQLNTHDDLDELSNEIELFSPKS